MRQTVLPSRRSGQQGVTLVEVLISLVILLIVFMGLIQASILTINHNLRNEIRDEATRIASEQMSIAKSTPVDTLAQTVGVNKICDPLVPCVLTTLTNCNATPTTRSRTFRNLSQQYTVTTGGCFTDANRNSAQVTVTVTYINPDQPATDLADPVKRQTMAVNSIVRRQ